MKNLFLIAFVGASLTGILPAKERSVELIGLWILDPDKSQVDQTTSDLPKIGVTGGVISSTDTDTNGDKNPWTGPIIEQAQDLTLRIMQTAAEVQVIRQFTAAGREYSIGQKFTLDSSQCFNPASNGRGDFATRSEWKKGKLINSGTVTIAMDGPRVEIYITEEFSVSQNGKKLTIKTMYTTPQGITKLKQEFLRKDEQDPGARGIGSSLK